MSHTANFLLLSFKVLSELVVLSDGTNLSWVVVFQFAVNQGAQRAPIQWTDALKKACTEYVKRHGSSPPDYDAIKPAIWIIAFLSSIEISTQSVFSVVYLFHRYLLGAFSQSPRQSLKCIATIWNFLTYQHPTLKLRAWSLINLICSRSDINRDISSYFGG